MAMRGEAPGSALSPVEAAYVANGGEKSHDDRRRVAHAAARGNNNRRVSIEASQQAARRNLLAPALIWRGGDSGGIGAGRPASRGGGVLGV